MFKFEVNWVRGNGDPGIKIRFGVSIERCDREILEICGLLVLQGLCRIFFPFHRCLRDLVRNQTQGRES